MRYKHFSKYLDSTYLKTEEEAGKTIKENEVKIKELVKEAIEYKFKSVMIRCKHVPLAKNIINSKKSNLKIGTVIDFPLGSSLTHEKVKEANYAIEKGVDEIDVVIDYNAFIEKNIDKVADDILQVSSSALNNNKIIKWIIETAALSNNQIKKISELIRDTITDNFSIQNKVYIKTSTGYYNQCKPNGATLESLKIIKEFSGNLQIKASGGISTAKKTQKMINAGASRIGTSSAKNIILGIDNKASY